jgi:hypothetical protein
MRIIQKKSNNESNAATVCNLETDANAPKQFKSFSTRNLKQVRMIDKWWRHVMQWWIFTYRYKSNFGVAGHLKLAP